MSDNDSGLNQQDAAIHIIETFYIPYWKEIHKLLTGNPELCEDFPAFILHPEQVIVYFGKHHFALEYLGPVSLETERLLEPAQGFELVYFGYEDSEHLLDAIVGISYEGGFLRLPVPPLLEDYYAPNDEAFDALANNGWNFAAQSMVMSFGTSGLELSREHFSRLRNCFFYGTDEYGLVTRHVRWMDIYPSTFVPVDENIDSLQIKFIQNLEQAAEFDVMYVPPKIIDFQQEKLIILNRFVELFSSSKTSETAITQFLSQPENQFILKMAFFGKELYPQQECEWSSSDKPAIIPDFFITSPNGYADIIEFKLPTLKSAPIVGRSNREAFSAEINSYVAQTRVYAEYFQDPKNREWVFEKYGIKVLYPRRWLVIGRRWMFATDEWRAIENDYRDVAIRTYDDLVDGIRSQLYT